MNTLHIVAGPPASGKSVFGKRLAHQLQAAFLDIDTATETVVRAGLQLAQQDPDDRDSPTFKETFREPIYETLFAVARENLAHIDVVLAGPFTRELRDSHWLEHLKALYSPLVQVHYVTCSPDIRRQRMQQRGNSRDAPKLADWDRYLSYYGSESPPPFEHRLIDTGETHNSQR